MLPAIVVIGFSILPFFLIWKAFGGTLAQLLTQKQLRYYILISSILCTVTYVFFWLQYKDTPFVGGYWESVAIFYLSFTVCLSVPRIKSSGIMQRVLQQTPYIQLCLALMMLFILSSMVGFIYYLHVRYGESIIDIVLTPVYIVIAIITTLAWGFFFTLPIAFFIFWGYVMFFSGRFEKARKAGHPLIGKSLSVISVLLAMIVTFSIPYSGSVEGLGFIQYVFEKYMLFLLFLFSFLFTSYLIRRWRDRYREIKEVIPHVSASNGNEQER